MKAKHQNIIAAIVGIFSCIAIWYLFIVSSIEFSRLTYLTILPPTIASLIGGLVIAAIAPKSGVKLSATAGCLLAFPLLALMLKSGFSHLGRNPLLWYWPMYIIPFFVLGACIHKRVIHGT